MKQKDCCKQDFLKDKGERYIKPELPNHFSETTFVEGSIGDNFTNAFLNTIVILGVITIIISLIK